MITLISIGEIFIVAIILYFLPFIPLIGAIITLRYFFHKKSYSLREDIFYIIILGFILVLIGIVELGLHRLYVWLTEGNLLFFIYNYLCLITGLIFLLLGGSLILLEVLNRAGVIYKVREKENYLDAEWLKHQYLDLGWSVQEIANDQNVTMMKVRKALESLGVDR